MVEERYDGLSEEEKYERADRNWKAEMEERLKRIHPQEIPMKGRMILHLPSRTILIPEDSNSDNDVKVDLIHNEFGCYNGELRIRADGSFYARHVWSEKYKFPVKIWEDTERVTKDIFEAADMEIVEYTQKFISGAAPTTPHHAYGKTIAEGKYKIKD